MNLNLRPAHILTMLIAVLLLINVGLFIHSEHRQRQWQENDWLLDIAVAGLGLTDLCVSTEARYTRHPAVSDPMVPFMDHPGAIDHFPTGSFWTPVNYQHQQP